MKLFSCKKTKYFTLFQLKNEENILIEAGLNESGMKFILDMISESYSILTEINPIMANRIDHKREIMDLQEMLKSIISQS